MSCSPTSCSYRSAQTEASPCMIGGTSLYDPPTGLVRPDQGQEDPLAPRIGRSPIKTARSRSGDTNGLHAQPFRVSINPSGELHMGNPG